MAGTAGGGGGTVAARFQVAAEGDRLKVTPRDPVWWLTCSDNLQPAQRVDGSWSVLRDDRPEGFNQHPAAHYLDGTYQSDCSLSLGCDVLVCEQMPTDPERIRDEMYVSTREFVQVGQQAAPTCDEEEQVRLDAGLDAGVLDGGLDAGGRQVPVLEARTPSGTLGMRIRYFPSNDCSGTPLTADVAVE
jgi:hypothetical protein